MSKSNLHHETRELKNDSHTLNRFLNRSRLWLYLVFLAIALTPLISYWLYYSAAQQQVKENLRTYTSTLAAMSALALEFGSASVTSSSAQSSPTELKALLEQLLENNPSIVAISVLTASGPELFFLDEVKQGTQVVHSPLTRYEPDTITDSLMANAIRNQELWTSPDDSALNDESALACHPVHLTADAIASVCLRVAPEHFGQSLHVFFERTQLIITISAAISLLIIYSVFQHQKQLRLSLALIEEQRDLFLNNSLTDPLTGALNRRAFHLAYAAAQSQLQRNNLPFSLVTIDIDHFKKVNDEHGHVSGDHVLTALVDNLNRVLRSSDHLARLGGEEFCVICNVSDKASAQRIAEKIRTTASDIRVVGEDAKEISFTVSIGIHFVNPAQSMDDALSAADKALYLAKAAGRNNSVFYHPDMQESNHES